jgi:nucleoside-diphosphate-sugar epimerase
MCRKVSECNESDEIEVWGDGNQTRSFLYIDDCLNSIEKMMNGDFMGPVNIGSDEMVTINELANMAIKISNKNVKIKNIEGNEFLDKYGFKCPVGVMGRNSDNRLFEQMIGKTNYDSLYNGMVKTYQWINNNVNKLNE